MAARGKSINMFLMDGIPTGRIKVTLANWTGITYLIPRTELDRCRNLDVLTQSGVYLLFGTDEQIDEDLVYIGQAGVRKNGEGLRDRLMEHKRNPEESYWTEAVVFTTLNNSFGPTEISYLENRFCNIAKEANRYIVRNANEPSPGHITEEKESELEDFLDYAKIAIGTLGHKVFEPLIQTASTAPLPEGSATETDAHFVIQRSGANANGVLTSEGFVVLAESIVRKELSPSASDSIRISREINKENIDDSGKVIKNILFRTPSGASAFVLGSPTNGRIEWKTADGKTLKNVETNADTSL